MERLEPLADGRLRYRLKSPRRDGTTHVIFQPLELLEKLSAISARTESAFDSLLGRVSAPGKVENLDRPRHCARIRVVDSFHG
jgi:hypothetical protein